MATPLAWHNLTHDRKRLATAVGGIGFAVLLMFMQLGFRGALFDSTIALAKRFDADIVLLQPQRYTLTVHQKFPRRYLDVARSHPAVDRASPLYLENIRSSWKLEGDPPGPPIRVVAFDPHEPVLRIGEVYDQAELLAKPEAALFDRRSKADFGNVRIGDHVEVNGRRVTIVGDYKLGTDFADDATLLIGDRTYNDLFWSHLPDGMGLEEIDFGLVRIRHDADADAVVRELDAMLPDNVMVLTKPDYLEFELSFWRTATPIGYIFTFGTVMGFIVGLVICYQVLSTDVADHLREFATLKAMGYRPPYFVGVVLQEALWLSVFGFGPGLLGGWALYEAVGFATGLPMEMPPTRIMLVFGLTVSMCVLSGCLAMRKLVTSDPAELF